MLTCSSPITDDCAMGAFTGMAMMGFFPVAGQDVYLIIVPFFREVRIKSQRDNSSTNQSLREAVIRKIGRFADDPLAVYIKSVRYNGREYNFSWITHRFFVNGGLLELEVSREESSWGTQEEDMPPSYPGSL